MVSPEKSILMYTILTVTQVFEDCATVPTARGLGSYGAIVPVGKVIGMWSYRLIGPGRFESVDTEAPSPDALAPGEVLLRATAGGICGSDIPKLAGRSGAIADGNGRLRAGRSGFPMHEVVGEVVASRHRAHGLGSRVVGWATRSDALAELVITDGADVHAYDTARTPSDAVLIQPLACVLEALQRVDVAGKKVGIVGLGPIGLLFAHAAKSADADEVVGVDPVDRAAVAAACGIDEVITAPSRTWARHLADPGRPDIVIEAVGHQVGTLDDAITAVRPGGSVLYFGIPDDEYYPLNMEKLLRKHLTLKAGVTRDRGSALTRADDYLSRHPVLADTLVSHRFGRDSVQQAYDTAAVAGPDRLKVVVTFE